MNLCLVLDTSTTICAVGLYKNQNLLSTIALHQPNVHSEKAAWLIQELLKITNISIHEITHLAIAKGPGSYTGLRIGFSLIKSLSYALNIPIIGYSTLYGQIASYCNLSHSMKKKIISCLDAGRNEIYVDVYDYKGNLIKSYGPMLLPHHELEKLLTYELCWVIGNGASKIQHFCKYNSHNTLFIHQIENPVTSLGPFLLTQIQNTNFENLITFEPDYLKPVNITISKK